MSVVDAAAGTPSGATTKAATPPVPPATLPNGWRWESYRNVQVGVPGDWGWSGTRNDNHWCFVREKPPPSVGRSHPGGAVRLTGCWHPKSRVHPGTDVEKTGMFVVFKSAELEEPGTTAIGRPSRLATWPS